VSIASHKDTWFAVAVRHAVDLCLYLEIKRSHKSDIYVFWPYALQEEQLHVSYHKDGRWYATSYDDLMGGHRRQKPGKMLVGSERVLTTPIHLAGVHALKAPCRRARSGDEYSEVFEIGADEINAEKMKYTTSLAIDLAEPGAPPSVPNVIRRVVFADAVPHIHIALWDPTELLTSLEEAKRQSRGSTGD
jgi:hypothetical protein